MKKVSIIIPVHNAADTLTVCVDSILAQTYSDLEVILVENYSTDDSYRLCQELQKKDRRIKVIRSEKKGVSAARNEGIRLAGGEYIGFCDADDHMEKEMYAYLVSLLEEKNASIAMCNGFVSYEKKEKALAVYPEDVILLDRNESILTLHRRSFFNAYVWNKLFLRELLTDIFFDEKLDFAEDYDFICKVLEKTDSVVCGSKKMYHYIQKKYVHDRKKSIEPYLNAQKMFEQYYNKWMTAFPNEKSLFTCYYMYDILGLLAAVSKSGKQSYSKQKELQQIVRMYKKAYMQAKEATFVMKICTLSASISILLYAWEYRFVCFLRNR